mgnify:CR=1 FL=1
MTFTRLPISSRQEKNNPFIPALFPKTIGQDEFLDRVHKFTGISRSLLAGAMQSFQNELKDLLANGWIVELGEIGYFSVSLQGPPVMHKKDVRAQSIKLKNINYLPTKQFKREVGYDMRLERTESLTRPKGNGRSEAECLALITAHLEKYPCMTRTDYCYMTGHDKKRALKELNAFIKKGILMRYGAGKQVFMRRKCEAYSVCP